ncbi:MAG: diguanylate cyclase, partial [Clostridia bacterium]
LNKRAKTICKMLQVEVADSMKISASLGIAIYPVDGTKYEELYNNADIAAYHAKAKGKNSFSMYNAGMNMYDTCCMSLLSPIDERDSEKEVYENEQLERKQNELEHYSRIFDNKNLAYIQWDAKRDEFFMSVTAHKYVLSTLTPQQLFVDNFDTNTIHPSDRKKFLRTFYSKIQKKKSSANCNFRLLLADGGYEMCSVTEIMILDERGEIDKALGIFVQSD